MTIEMPSPPRIKKGVIVKKYSEEDIYAESERPIQ